MLPGALENVPGAEHATTKGEEGTIRQDSDTGKKVETTAKTAGAAGRARASEAGSAQVLARPSACCRVELMCAWSRGRR
jgi:hypothetical protein